MNSLTKLTLLTVALMPFEASAQQLIPTYESPAIEALIAEAANTNIAIPERLRAYRAHVETEMSVAVTDSAGRERTTQVEQIASEVRWIAPFRYDQRVVGYRSQSVGPTFSLMSMFGGWTTPTLYGNRLQLGVSPPNSGNTRMAAANTGLTIHPLAPQRATYYTFAGGDTVVVLFSRGRRIHVVNVRVTPRADAPGDAVLFTGDMQLDADRKHVVRLRGRTVEMRGGRPVLATGSRVPGSTGASFIELVSGEIDGEYWLPAYQRTEFHARFGLLGGFRVMVRIVSRFDDYRTNDSSWSGPTPPGPGHHLTLAPSDSLSRYGQWRSPIGDASSDVAYADFDDVTPEAWRGESRTGVRIRPESFSELFRFNRIEGVYTGIPLRRDFGEGDSVVTVRGSLGWAWAEQTARGNFAVERRRGPWLTGVRLQRALAHTNDFQPPLSWGSTVSALLGSTDNYDYLDRRSASAVVQRFFGIQRHSNVRLEIGGAADRRVWPNVSRGLFIEGVGFRPNRGIREGNYVSSAASLELNPQVSGLFVDRGVGARLHYQRADGGLTWQRLELRAAARRELGPLQLYARADVGTLFGDPAPQVLFEIGSAEGLSAYGYKEFVGDRAAMLRAVAGYTLPILRGPIRLPGNLFAPGLAPGIAAGVQTAWTELSSPEAERAALELGTIADESLALVPLSRPTDGVVGSVEVLATFFSGAFAIGVARPIDRAGGWRLTARVGQGF